MAKNSSRANNFDVFHIPQIKYYTINIMKINFMLRRTGRKSARVPLTREGLTLRCHHADGCTGVDEERPMTCPTVFGYRGFRCRYRLQASRISPAFGFVVLPNHTIGVGCGLTSYLSPKGETKNPRQIVSVTDGDQEPCGTHMSVCIDVHCSLTTETCRLQN